MVAITQHIQHLLFGTLLLAVLILADFHAPKFDLNDAAMLEKARGIYKDAHKTAGQTPEIINVPISSLNSEEVLNWRLHFWPQLSGAPEATIDVGKWRPYWKLGNWRLYYGRKRVYYAARVEAKDYPANRMGLKASNGRPGKEAFALWRKIGHKPELLAIDTFDIVPDAKYPLTSLNKFLSLKELLQIKV